MNKRKIITISICLIFLLSLFGIVKLIDNDNTLNQTKYENVSNSQNDSENKHNITDEDTSDINSNNIDKTQNNANKTEKESTTIDSSKNESETKQDNQNINSESNEKEISQLDEDKQNTDSQPSTINSEFNDIDEKNNISNESEQTSNDTKEQNTNEIEKDISLDKAIEDSIQYILQKDSFDDWDIIALKIANSNSDISDLINEEKYTSKKSEELTTSFDKYSLTDCAKTILVLNSLNQNPYDFQGYNLVEKMKTLLQKEDNLINGHIWGIIALEACDAEYDKESALNYLYKEQKNDGGFSIIPGNETSDETGDITAMAVYSMTMTNEYVDNNIQNALSYLNETINKSKNISSESLSQIVMAIIATGDDLNKFTINNNNIINELLSYRCENGSFKHIKDGQGSNISTQQALMALIFAQKNENLFKTLSITEANENIDDIVITEANKEYGTTDVNNPLKIKGNLEIQANNVNVKNVEIDGNIVINPGLKGETSLYNVTANNITILSGGINSIHFYNVEANSVLLDSQEKTRIENKGNTKIHKTLAKTDVILDNISGEFGYIEINSNDNQNVKVELKGNFTKPIKVMTSASINATDNSEISNLIIDTKLDDKVIVEGNIKNIDVLAAETLEIKGNSIIDNLNNESSAEINKDENVLIKESTGKISDEDSKAKTEESKGKLTIVGYKKTILNSYSFTIQNGDTVADILKRILDKKNISYSMKSDKSYLYTIDKQSEGDIGPLSGWKYSINGDFPSMGINQQNVYNGDNIKFIFALNPNDTKGIDKTAYEQNKPKISISGISNGQVVKKSILKFNVNIEDNKDSTITPEVTVNGSNIKSTTSTYSVTLQEGNNLIIVNAEDSQGFKNQLELSFVYEKEDNNSNDDDEDNNDDDEIIIFDEEVKTALIVTNGGILNFTNDNLITEYLKILIFDEKDNIGYLNDFLVDKKERKLNLFLKSGTYHGYIMIDNEEKITIDSFKIK